MSTENPQSTSGEPLGRGRFAAVLSQEGYHPVSPTTLDDPLYRITYAIKEEIRRHKWIEAEKGNDMSWEDAKRDWLGQHRTAFLHHYQEIFD